MDIHTLNGLAGKRRPRRPHVKHQPLAVGRPGIGIGEQVITGSKGYLFHGVVLIQNGSRHHTSQGLHFQTIVFCHRDECE
ncbi:hypothetical protein ExPUPEC121_03019 [Escherichia coli]|nr:hypothetical protein ExPUPEC121_03019 [Escherichia coli]